MEGTDWRCWTAADRAAVAYLLLKRQHKKTSNTQALRALYELVEDKNALAVLDRSVLGQSDSVEVTDVRPRHG